MVFRSFVELLMELNIKYLIKVFKKSDLNFPVNQ